MTSVGDDDDLDGAALPLPLWWKLLAKAEMDRQEFTQATLALRVGCSQANISQALADEYRTSRHAITISRVLGIPEPAVIPSSAERSALLARLLVAAEQLSEGDTAILEAQVALLEAQAKRR